MGAPSSTDYSHSGLSRFAGSGCAGLLELLGFHPIDTVAKRLMSNTKPVGLNYAIFANHLRFLSLVPPRLKALLI
ncbi:high copy suppressor of abf2 [Entomophthora muscae]|uniref:High copy suppressor of abf2 n=1 Tax=Entomophthora muscae TaxID=34485 RepID=A0ACC2U9I6_9FUNG|nr:high copy suppressor of abf2 [Entomophthora muscae]